MNELKPKTLVFFKARPKTEHTPPNAIVERFLGQIPNGDAVYEITYRNERWQVARIHIATKDEALQALAIQLAIQHGAAVKAAGKKHYLIAKHLGISTATLSKQMAIVRNHLPHDKASTVDQSVPANTP